MVVLSTCCLGRCPDGGGASALLPECCTSRDLVRLSLLTQVRAATSRWRASSFRFIRARKLLATFVSLIDTTSPSVSLMFLPRSSGPVGAPLLSPMLLTSTLSSNPLAVLLRLLVRSPFDSASGPPQPWWVLVQVRVHLHWTTEEHVRNHWMMSAFTAQSSISFGPSTLCSKRFAASCVSAQSSSKC